MLEHLNVEKLPYVDGIPADGQTRIDWVKNGERLTAAEHCTSNEGTLNRAPLAVQKNVVHVHEQHTKTADKINEIVDQVNNINTALGAVGDHSVINLLNETVDRVTVNEQHLVEMSKGIVQVVAEQAALQAQIGERLPDDTTDRNLREELEFQKSEMGAYIGYDVNGKPDPQSYGSGMKYRIQSNTAALHDHGQRIEQLEKDWHDSDVGDLTDKVEKLRNEIGASNLATQDNIYLRLRSNTRNIANVSNEIGEIKKAIQFDREPPIGERVTDLNDKYTALNRDVNGAENGFKPRLLAVENKIGTTGNPDTILGRLDTTERALSVLHNTVGASGSDGLRGQVAGVIAQIGLDTDRHTIAGRLKVLETNTNQIGGTVHDLEQKIGGVDTGLTAGVIKLSTEMYGDPQGANQFAKDGLIKTVKALSDSANSKPTDVQDEGYYLRKNGEWIRVGYAACAFKSIQQTLVTLDQQGTYKVIPLATTQEEFPSRAITKAENSFTINDAGIFRIDFRAGINHPVALQNATYVVGVFKNGTLVESTGNGYYAMDEHVNYVNSTFINISKGDEISIQIKGISPEAIAQPVEIDNLLVAVSPV